MQEYNLKLTPRYLLIYPHSPHGPHPLRAPCNTYASRCIRHRTRSKPGVVSVYPTNYKKNFFLSIYRMLNAFRKYEKTNSEQDHLQNPTTYIVSTKAHPGANKDVRLLLYLHLQYLVPLLINYLQARNEPDFPITFYHPEPKVALPRSLALPTGLHPSLTLVYALLSPFFIFRLLHPF